MSSNKPHQDADDRGVTAKTNPDGWKVSPRGFKIIWGSDSRYWKITEPYVDVEKQAVKRESVELVQVCWLELTGSIPELSKGKTYKITFEITMKEGAFGWNGCPVFMMAKIGNRGKYKYAKLNLPELIKPGETKTIPSGGLQIQVPQEAQEAQDRKLYFGLYEVWSGKWKGGLQIHEAVVEQILS